MNHCAPNRSKVLESQKLGRQPVNSGQAGLPVAGKVYERRAGPEEGLGSRDGV
jgi:hypothetical protein